MRLGAFAAVSALVAVAGCGDSATSPSSDGVPRSGTHTISAGDLTVTYWFVFNPPPDSAVRPGTSYSVEVHCRASRAAEYRLSTYFDPLAPDGTVLPPLNPITQLGATNIGYDVNFCASNFALANGSLPFFSFGSIPSFNIRVFLRPIPPTSIVDYDIRLPDMVVNERVNWRQ